MSKGKVIGTNPPENKGTIQADDNQLNYIYNVKAGHTVGGYTPKAGDIVNFIKDDTNKVATGVEKVVVKSPDCTLAAKPNPVDKTLITVLYYSTSNATGADIQPNIGQVPVGENQTVVDVRITADTKFTLTVRDDNGNSEVCSVTVFLPA